MTIEKGIEIAKQLKEFCSERECNNCPFKDKSVLLGNCLLKGIIPASLDIKEFEENAKNMRKNAG